ncbi:MAG: hypothetical protein LBU69_06610 [Deltaproteobacteria bacterium]|jgi:predicted Fe-Mo cluster-binding NifX family protein|nr:hypothetical protein [Deltaproteobacteria bacterium]
MARKNFQGAGTPIETTQNPAESFPQCGENGPAKRVSLADKKRYRPKRVAVASETGENIDACFGRVESFRVYRLVEGESDPSYELEETRKGPHPCQDKQHNQEILSMTAELLSDCGMVLAGRIGPAAIQALSERGVLGLAASLPIEEALRRLASK